MMVSRHACKKIADLNLRYIGKENMNKIFTDEDNLSSLFQMQRFFNGNLKKLSLYAVQTCKLTWLVDCFQIKNIFPYCINNCKHFLSKQQHLIGTATIRSHYQITQRVDKYIFKVISMSIEDCLQSIRITYPLHCILQYFTPSASIVALS